MQDDKFKKLSDEEMEIVSGGKIFSVVNTGHWWKGHHVKDEKGALYGKCWTASGAQELCDELNGLNLKYTIENQQVQRKTIEYEKEQVEVMKY